MKERSNRRFISLFSGCGGFDLGLVKAGFECHLAIDNDEAAIQNHQHNIRSATLVHDLNIPSVIIESAEGMDLLIAGPPCQGFSTLGKRRIDDPRNGLLLLVGHFAELIKPKVVVVENVMGILSGQHKQYWDKLKLMLLSQGYSANVIRCDVTALGVPQTRRRVIMVAWKGKNHFSFPELIPRNVPLEPIFDRLENVSNNDKLFLARDSDDLRIAKHIKQGQKLCDVRDGNRSVHTWDIPEVFGIVSCLEKRMLHTIMKLRRQIRIRDVGDADPVRLSDIRKQEGSSSEIVLERLTNKGFVKKVGKRFDLANTFNGKYRRLMFNKPSFTVDTRFTEPRYFLHPLENRGLTVREAARIQGFPDEFVFLGDTKTQTKLIGNAVPPPLAEWVGKNILRNLID
jgi:DNA (cytosine-5)-methyltransferase 1